MSAFPELYSANWSQEFRGNFTCRECHYENKEVSYYLLGFRTIFSYSGKRFERFVTKRFCNNCGHPYDIVADLTFLDDLRNRLSQTGNPIPHVSLNWDVVVGQTEPPGPINPQSYNYLPAL